MRNMKRIAACLLVLAMVLTLFACKPSDTDVDEPGTTTTTSSTAAQDPTGDSTTGSTDLIVDDVTDPSDSGDGTTTTDGWYGGDNDDYDYDDDYDDGDGDEIPTTTGTVGKGTTATGTKATASDQKTTSKATTTTTKATTTTTTKPTYTGPDYVATVKTGNVVNVAYDGVGADVIPMNLMSGHNGGYNDAYWEAEVSRILKLSPNMVRFWTQVDWYEPEKEQYTWDSPQMEACKRYFKAFKDAGVAVQLTLNWKVDESIWDWFSIPGLWHHYWDANGSVSAPLDLEAFARSTSKLLQNLWSEGYTNVKYITFANEPDREDFESHGDQVAYYLQLATIMDKQFKADGIRDKVEFWGPESGEFSNFYNACIVRPDLFDAISYHNYVVTPDELANILAATPADGVQKNYITEYGQTTDPIWKSGIAGVSISGSQKGFTGLLNWCLNGVGSMGSKVDKDDWNMENSFDFWASYIPDQVHLDNNVTPGMVRDSYYIASMFTRFVERDSTVLETTVNTQGMRATTIVSPSGDYTIAVEYNESDQDRNITLNFDKSLGGKTFYKHVYVDGENIDQNALIPPVVGTFKVDKQLKDDDVPNKYSVVVYTTMKPYTQVKFNEAYVELKAGESFDFDATIVDGEGEIEWSIAMAANGKVNKGRTYLSDRAGTITQNGVYTAAANAVGGANKASHEDAIAIKAKVKGSDTYSIAIVKIVQ